MSYIPICFFPKKGKGLQRSKEMLHHFEFKITDLAHELSDFCTPRVRNENRARLDISMPSL
jgi:hypothetical protein